MRRRQFIAGLAGAAAWPLAAQAQQQALPVVGFLNNSQLFVAPFRKGLSETGFVEGRNVTIEYRSANDKNDRLPELVADLVRRHVTVIAALSLQTALAAKAATTIIPIVFRTGADPVQYGLVASFNRPGGNITGINDISFGLGPKRLGLLHDLLPGASRFALLVDPTAAATESMIADIGVAASAIGRPIEVVTASSNSEIDTAFAILAQKRVDALLVPPTALFADRRVQLITLTAHQSLPAIYGVREDAEIGGLMSYGPVITDQIRQAGIYTGRILKGEKPSELPVLRPTKFEFVINLQTARTLGIEVPPGLLAIADEVIE
jgi:putative tryptophan/tyrosine transport system substrate-binding protein